MTRDYTPRPTQTKMIVEVVERLKKHDDCALIASTGTGKTICAAHLAAYYAQVFNPKKDATWDSRAWSIGTDFQQIVFIVHLDSLVKQTYDKFREVFKSRFLHMGKKRERGMEYGITYIKSGLNYDAGKPIVIASLQTLNKRYEHYITNNWLKPAMFIFDECHTTAFCDVGRKLINDVEFKKRIGLTATPFRLEKEVSFSDLWDNAVVSPSFGEMVRRGELCPIIYKQFISSDELKEVKRGKGGEYREKDVVLKFNTPERIKFAIDKWEQHASERPTIVFTIDVAHGESVREQFVSKGYKAEIISYKVDSKDREPLYEKFSSGDVQILISVRALAVGFDEPSCSCGIDLQPTTSISNHWQKIGRIARLHLGKSEALWLDFVGNIENLGAFGCPDDIEMTEIDVLSKKDFTRREGEAPRRICPECGHVNHASVKKCVGKIKEDDGEEKDCGYEFPQKLIADAAPKGDLVTIITKSMVNDYETARAYYRSLRHKRYVKRQHPNAAYHEYINTEPIFSSFPIPHPRDRVAHKVWSVGCVTGQPDNFNMGIEFLDEITRIVRKMNRDSVISRSLIDSAIWLEFSEDIYNRLVSEIDRFDERQREFSKNLFVS